MNKNLVIELYEVKRKDNAKQIVCRYKTNKESYKITNDSEEIEEKINSINDVLKMINPNGKYNLNIIKKNDYIKNHNKINVELDDKFDLSTYLNNIQLGQANNQHILLNYVSDDADITIEPTSALLTYFDIYDLAKGYINDNIFPKKEFLVNDSDKYVDVDFIEKKNIRDYFKDKPEEKIKAKSNFWKNYVIALGAVGIILGIKGFDHIIDQSDEFKKNLKNQPDTHFYNNKVINGKIYGDSKPINNAYEKYFNSNDSKEDNSVKKDDSSKEQVQKISDEEHINQDGINIELEGISDDYDKLSVYKEVEKKYGNMILEISTKYGIDSKLLTAIITQESGGISSKEFNEGGAIGLCQIQNSNLGVELTAYNYVTDQEETITLDMDTLQDDYKNIEVGAIFFQNLLDQFEGNIFLALQAYNYGPGMVCSIVEEYSNAKIYAYDDNVEFKSFDDIVLDQKDIGWLDFRNDNYGDSEYVEHVVAPFADEKVQFTCYYQKGKISKVNISSTLVKDSIKSY